MTIGKDALLRVVKATRIALHLAEDTRKQLVSGGWTWADEISGMLCDVLFSIAGETLEPNQDFRKHSRTYMLLAGDLSDGEVTDEFIRLAEANAPKMPAPILMTEDERNALYGTPEGEWR